MEQKDFSYQFYKTTSEAWDAMYQALLSAQKSIFWEIFIFVDDIAGSRFVDALCEKARSGLEVKIIIDAYGSFSFSWAAERRLRDAGVEVLRFNRLHPELRLARWLARLWFRNHRKVLIVDEWVVFLGGVNIHAAYQSWDDMYLKLAGPLARPLLRGFAKSYISAGGEKRNVRKLLGTKLSDDLKLWKEKFKFIVHSPRFKKISKTRRLFVQALTVAKESVNFLTPYFVPDKQFLQAVALARRRGVKVNIFLPLRTDSKLLELLALTYYGHTLKAGANIYFLPTMNHGKAMSVDNTLGHVGSINITPRSFYFNEESGVSFSDERMVNDLNVLFNEWKKIAQPFDEERWKKRGVWSKIKEWWVRRVENFL
ncbi:MAG: phosphatidylserine/phosphatidylglycerophosphate/cardiolipin synthase family protein [Candidatus Magasanikbacteria bacterium]|nr:phosphatidylserine/phosphatidylglycerophosphate/cardiolipin synthase family protein [Candidatus Magasanikbacteria bacterium]